MTREMPNLRRTLLGLFAVINSPILVYSQEKELLYSLWPRQAGYGRTIDKNLAKQFQAQTYLTAESTSNLNNDSDGSLGESLKIEEMWQAKRQDIVSQSQQIVLKWQHSIGEPLYINDDHKIGGILLSSGLYVVIGPITPLRVKVNSETLFIDNQTARSACNMWFNIARDQCRVLEHSRLNQDSHKFQDKWTSRKISVESNTFSLDSTIEATIPTHTLEMMQSLDSVVAYPRSEYKSINLPSFEQYQQFDAFDWLTTEDQSMTMDSLVNLNQSYDVVLPKQQNQNSNSNESLSKSPSSKPPVNFLSNDKNVTSNIAVEVAPVDLKKIDDAAHTVYDPYNGDDIKEAFNLDLNLNDLQQIQTVRQHNLYRNEVLIQEAIREGNVEKLKWAYQLPNKGKIGILGPTPLRSWQNHAHLHNVLASRAAIDAGVTPEEAYTLSDRLFLLVEDITDPLLAKHMRYVVAKAFTDLVHQHKERLGDSVFEPPIVFKARSIIQNSLTDKITLKDIVTKIGCSEQYLCRLFKATHKMSVMQYITKQRLHLAKDLLRESDTSISDIASLLQFSSTSHFCRVFKEFEQLTPAKWRQMHALSL